MREVNADQKSVREFCVTQTLAVVVSAGFSATGTQLK
jgi:hypothetical protein